MKGKIIGKILIILLAIVMVLPLSTFAASAEEASNTNNVPGYIQDIYNNGRTPSEQAEYNALKWQLQLESDISYVSAYVKEQEKLAAQNKSTKATKEAWETTKKALRRSVGRKRNNKGRRDPVGDAERDRTAESGS